MISGLVCRGSDEPFEAIDEGLIEGINDTPTEGLTEGEIVEMTGVPVDGDDDGNFSSNPNKIDVGDNVLIAEIGKVFGDTDGKTVVGDVESSCAGSVKGPSVKTKGKKVGLGTGVRLFSSICGDRTKLEGAEELDDIGIISLVGIALGMKLAVWLG
mmetsp:Transcript_28667/g.40532  ORF Transcript_28667/g.40532 Transcript_28667/m.40532 type:complete len:156 (-) Transcript_28667:136-603(-)